MRGLRHEPDELRGKWLWFVILGALLVLVGMAAIGAPQVASLATVNVLGVVLLVTGVFRAVGAFWARTWSGLFLVLLGALLTLVLGVIFLRTPIEALAALALLVAASLLVSGIFQIVGAATYRLPGWGWYLAGGVLNVLLGLIILVNWPDLSLALIGLFVGIDMVFDGWTWIMIGLALRTRPRSGV